MENKILLLVWLFFQTINFLEARSMADWPERSGFSSLDPCNAPPPEGLAVKARGTHFISLVWTEAPGYTQYYLEVYEETGANAWDLIFVFSHIPDASKTVYDLRPGKRYRFKVATQCPNGDPGASFVVVEDITLILELTLGGRMPVDPTPQNDCEPIEYLNPKNEWVGYRITHMEGGALISNFFEFVGPEETEGGVPQLRRFSNNSIIVAGDQDGNFPDDSEPIVYINDIEYINMGTYDYVFERFGEVNISLYNNPPQVEICKVQEDWNEEFVFQPLVASKAAGIIPFNRTNPGKEVGLMHFQVESPFSNQLRIYVDNERPDTIQLDELLVLDMHGRVVFRHLGRTDSLVIESEPWATGMYLVRYKQDDSIQVRKIFKL